MKLRSLPGYPALFVDYVESTPSACSFFPSHPDRGTLLSHAALAMNRNLPREDICEVLEVQAKEMGSGDSIVESIRRLSHRDSIVVLASLPPNLLGGPLGLILKCLTVAKLASELSRNGISAVPVVWLQAVEDSSATTSLLLLDGESNPVRLTLDATARDPMVKLVDNLMGMATSSWNLQVLHEVSAFCSPGTSYRAAGKAFLARICDPLGLIWLDEGTPGIQALVDRNLSRIGNEPAGRVQLVQERVRELEEAGYSDNLDLGSDRAVASLVDSWILQGSLLPVAAIVSGVTDLPIYALTLPVFRHLGWEPPLIWPRLSATIVDARVRKTVEKYGLSIEDLFAGTQEALSKTGVERAQQEVLSRFGEVIAGVESRVKELSGLATEDGLRGDVESSGEKILYQLSKLRDRSASAGVARCEAARRQLGRACNLIVPELSSQECKLSALYFLLRYSRAILDQIYDKMSIWDHDHQIINVD